MKKLHFQTIGNSAFKGLRNVNKNDAKCQFCRQKLVDFRQINLNILSISD